MKPFLFGSSKRPLFGIYQPPLASPGRDVGVVVCNPFGQEAVRAHRALRQLSLLLARARFHVLRFDYSGTGDSAGASAEISVKAWREDIVTASDELRDTAGVGKVSWVGLRLGATLAALAAQGRKDVDQLVAWDAVVSGRTYLAELHRVHVEYLQSENRWWTPSTTGPADMIEALGFPVTESFKQEVVGVDLADSCTFSAKRTALIVSDETDGHRRLRQRLEAGSGGLPRNITYDLVPTSAWNSEAAMASSLVPMAALQAIANRLSEARS